MHRFRPYKNLATPWPCHYSAAFKASTNKLNNNFIDAVAKLISCSSIAKTALFEDLSGSKYVSYENHFSLRQVSVKDVKCIIDSLLLSATVGQDQISATMLKKSPIAVFEALAFIFNESLFTGIFPDVWKSAVVVPVRKRKTHKLSWQLYANQFTIYS